VWFEWPASGQTTVVRTASPSSDDRLTSLWDACDGLEAELTFPRALSAGSLGWPSPRVAVDGSIWRCHVAVARRGAAHERSRLIAHYLPHAKGLARRLHRSGEPLEDLEQVAAEGLLLALERFDPSRGLPFLGFANPTIMGSLKRHYRDTGWSVRVARRVHDMIGPLRDAEEMLGQELGRSPTDEEIADLLGCDPDEVDAIRAVEQLRTPASLDRAHVSIEGSEHSLADELGTTDRAIEGAERRLAAEQVIGLLESESRELIGLYYQDGLTQAQIAERLGVSQMQVSRLLERIVSQLRSHLPEAI
jgi:RNA polymerase sigma-B factor